MLRDRLVPDVEFGSGGIAMRVEADINGVRQIPRQAAFSAGNVENFVSWSNQFADAREFGPGDAGKVQCPVKVSAPIKVHVKSLVTGQHRIEEGEPAGGFPQVEVVDPAELPLC